jgi:peptidoglycan/xylan/chitin deacetylase (PgdA/CDA1 family)
MPPHARSATEEELCSAAAVAGISLGSHTWSHPNLAALGAAELDDEMRRPLEWLRERFEGIVPYLTYPYGLFSSAVQEAARGAGYLAALRIDGGWVRRDALDMFAAPRLDVPSRVSLAGFRLRVAGLCS